MNRPLHIYVDVDDTFVRSYGTKRIPIPSVIEHIKTLKQQGALLYCWSSGGAEYARASAEEFGVEHCFLGFLPKPEVMIDDIGVSHWRNLLHVHPNECPDSTVDSYRNQLIERHKKPNSGGNQH